MSDKICDVKDCGHQTKSIRSRYCPGHLKQAYQKGQRLTTLHLIIRIKRCRDGSR